MFFLQPSYLTIVRCLFLSAHEFLKQQPISIHFYIYSTIDNMAFYTNHVVYTLYCVGTILQQAIILPILLTHTLTHILTKTIRHTLTMTLTYTLT